MMVVEDPKLFDFNVFWQTYLFLLKKILFLCILISSSFYFNYVRKDIGRTSNGCIYLGIRTIQRVPKHIWSGAAHKPFLGYHNKENSGLKDITLVMLVVHQQGALIAIFRAKCVLLYYIFMNSLSCHFTYFCSNMSFQEQK